MRFQLFSFIILFSTIIMAQEEFVDTTVVDTASDTVTFEESTFDTSVVAVDDSVNIDEQVDLLGEDIVVNEEEIIAEPVLPMDEPVVIEEVSIQPDSIPAEWLGLEYGYKGYAWGTSATSIPRYTYMDTIFYNADTSQIIMNGQLGEHSVTMFYSFSDSGFWKVEIDYMIDPMDMDKQINQFYAIEKSLYEVYQKPSSTNQVISGPKSGTVGLNKLTFERSYLHTTWKEIPCQIELILLGAVQAPKTELAVISGPTSILRLVYFNPDYMVYTMAGSDPEELPSIFDIY